MSHQVPLCGHVAISVLIFSAVINLINLSTRLFVYPAASRVSKQVRHGLEVVRAVSNCMRVTQFVHKTKTKLVDVYFVEFMRHDTRWKFCSVSWWLWP